MKKYLIAIVLIIVSIYACLTFTFAINGYPGFIQDSTCFLPTAYFINHFHQLINPLYDAGLDPINHRFLFYPPLFPCVVALINSLMPEFYNNMQVSLAIIDLMSLIILIVAVYIYTIKRKVNASFILCFLVILWLFALFSFYGVQEGRPEVLCKFFISCFLLNNVYQSKRFCNFNNGVLVTLNMITSPVSTFYLILITAGLLFYRNEFKLKPILQTALGFMVIAGVFTIFYPYHIIDLIQALRQHSKNVIVNRYSTNSLKTFINFYITYTYAPFLIFNFLIPVIYVARILVRKKMIIALGLLAVLSILVAYFSFRDMPMNYNMLVLSPVFFFVLFVMITKQFKGDKRSIQFKIVPLAIAFILLVNATGFIRRSLLFYNTQDEIKITYNNFRAEFLRVASQTNKGKKVGITFSLWPYCLDHYKNITLNQTDTSIQYLMVQQLYSGATEPPPLKDYKLIKNNFITKHPKLGKLPLGNTYPWFQTATYERK
ncbi:MAG: hypothetical protein V5804_03850 [Mucilaginibacter sp.]|uniref:hypothetical protein n=1 Tax=Mucilaginibacter sp. TaxID=1882438 RepID=UPI0034E5BF5D